MWLIYNPAVVVNSIKCLIKHRKFCLIIMVVKIHAQCDGIGRQQSGSINSTKCTCSTLARHIFALGGGCWSTAERFSGTCRSRWAASLSHTARDISTNGAHQEANICVNKRRWRCEGIFILYSARTRRWWNSSQNWAEAQHLKIQRASACCREIVVEKIESMPFASCEIIVFCNEAAAAAARRRRLRGATCDLIVVPIKRSSVNAACFCV